MSKNHFMYFLNSNGINRGKTTFERDRSQQHVQQISSNEQTKIINNGTNHFLQPNYPMKQYVDEHITNDVWISNGNNNHINSNNWNDGFSENMKSSQWNDHGLNNRKSSKWREYTQKRNPWV